jgi:uncharacterized membrane protein
MDGLFILVALVIAIWLYTVVPAQMAGRRDRSAVGWVLISLIFSPFVAIIALLVLGHPYRPEQK